VNDASPGRPTVAARIASLPVRGWRVFSTRMPPHCRFYPSCSAYALEALERHGAARGTLLAVRRIGRCHPWNPGGVDRVPPSRVGASSGADRPGRSAPGPAPALANVRSPRSAAPSAEAPLSKGPRWTS
jgi:uncharacterized protein